MKTSLQRVLGLPMLIFYGVGMILGAGIYSIIGKAAEKTGETLWQGFLLAGIISLITALSYAELSTMYPKAGAEFTYLREAFKKHKWIAATIGVTMVLSGTATAATVSLAFAGYLNQFIHFSSESGIAALILILLSSIAIIGIRYSGWATVISTLIEVGGLIFIIYFGLQAENFIEPLSLAPSMQTLSGTALIIFSFFGFENIVTLAEESKRPERDLPRALILSVLIAMLLYFLVSLSSLALLSLENLSTSQAPLMSVAQTVSKKAGNILGVIALFSTANTALISMIGASRILYSMSREEAIPKIIAYLQKQRKTPWVASLIVLMGSLLLLPLGRLEKVASISSLATMMAFFSVNVALITLRYSQGSHKRPFRIPLNIGNFPFLPLVGAVSSLILMLQFHINIYLITGFILIISASYFVWNERRKMKFKL